MTLSLKHFYLLLPAIAAVMWGGYYAIMERMLGKISAPTWIVLMYSSMLVFNLIASRVLNQKIDFTPVLQDKKLLLLLAVAVAFYLCGVYALVYGTQKVSVTYAAFGEVAYPLLVPVFAYLFFGVKEVDRSLAVGGVFVMIGLGIMIYGKSKTIG